MDGELEYLSVLDVAGIESEIITSSVVNFIAEYRVFVINKRIYDCRRYSGDFSVYPNFSFIKETTRAYDNAPIAYAIDFGVTDKGETMLIEVNDGYSIGSYGFNHMDYIKLCILRWNQMVENINY